MKSQNQFLSRSIPENVSFLVKMTRLRSAVGEMGEFLSFGQILKIQDARMSRSEKMDSSKKSCWLLFLDQERLEAENEVLDLF